MIRYGVVVVGRGRREKRWGIVVHQRHCWVRWRWWWMWIQAIVVTAVKAAEGRVGTVEVRHSQGPTRRCWRLGRALVAGLVACWRTSGWPMWGRMVRSWSWMMGWGWVSSVERQVWVFVRSWLVGQAVLVVQRMGGHVIMRRV